MIFDRSNKEAERNFQKMLEISGNLDADHEIYHLQYSERKLTAGLKIILNYSQVLSLMIAMVGIDFLDQLNHSNRSSLAKRAVICESYAFHLIAFFKEALIYLMNV
jgi:hypothetical protein